MDHAQKSARKNRRLFCGGKTLLGPKTSLRCFHLRQKIAIAIADKSLHLPCPSCPCFLEFLVFLFPARISFFVFVSVFAFFSRDFRGPVGIENPCFFLGGGFLAFSKKNKGKEGQGGALSIAATISPIAV